MANNRVRIRGKNLRMAVADGGVASGDPCLVGAAITGVAETPKDGSNIATVAREGVYSLSVKGVTNGASNIAVAVGDKLFYSSAHTPKIDKDTTGVFFGWANGAVNSGATTTIDVILAGGSSS